MALEDGHRQIGMCPHCGGDVAVVNGLTDHHTFVGDLCPGSEQVARCAESDARPLWNGERNGRFRG